MPLREPKYKPDQTIVRSFGKGKYKISKHAWLRISGVEDESEDFRHYKGMVNDEKLDSNIQHTRNRIFEIAFCNSWDYFTTFTIDKNKFDRFNLDTYHKAFRKWLNNYNKYHGTSIRYLTIPEKHKDGAWHEHGFIEGLPREHLRLFTLNEKLPKYLRDKLKEGEQIYDWPAYRVKFGFCDFEPIRNPEAVSKYITKYITKTLVNNVTKINAHSYYCSQGLKRSEIIKKGTMSANIVPDYGNEHVQVNWVSCADAEEEKNFLEWLNSVLA